MQSHYPRLLLDETVCRRNIRFMAEKATANQVLFRPHFKTHQSGVIGQWFRDEGVSTITVSSVKMAAYFAAEGWKDIFIAFPASLPETKTIDHLAGHIHLDLSVESVSTALYLNDHLTNPVGIYIKVDTGYHRTGIDPADTREIARILNAVGRAQQLTLKGFYTHSGHTYEAKTTKRIEQIHEQSVQSLSKLRNLFRKDHPGIKLSIGDTPSCSWIKDFGEIDEIRPGNFVFYDLMQEQLGICSIQDIAVALECPVVSKNSERNELVIHGGAVHLSKEFLLDETGIIFGRVVPLTGQKWGKPMENTFLKSLSQEHGIIKADPKHYNAIRVGDTVGILPVHSCLTANLADHYLTTRGEIIPKTRS